MQAKYESDSRVILFQFLRWGRAVSRRILPLRPLSAQKRIADKSDFAVRMTARRICYAAARPLPPAT
jgi:hypothetical protein